MLRIEVVLTENEIADEFLRGFRRRNIPEKFFYWFPLSVRAWLNLCKDGEYRNFIRSYRLVTDAADEIAEQLPSRVEVVSLGSGQGHKDMILLGAARKLNRDLTYVPVDSSQALLEMACQGAADAGIEHRGLKLDVENSAHWEKLKADGPPRLYIVLGNTMGAFDPLEFVRRLRALLRPEDFLVIDGEIFASESMAGYDNPTNRRFAFAPLASVGIRESDGVLRFESKADARFEGLHYFPKHFEPCRNLEVVIGGEMLGLERGARLDMNLSYKYSRLAIPQLLKELGGFEPLREYLSDDQRFLMVFARPA